MSVHLSHCELEVVAIAILGTLYDRKHSYVLNTSRPETWLCVEHFIRPEALQYLVHFQTEEIVDSLTLKTGGMFAC